MVDEPPLGVGIAIFVAFLAAVFGAYEVLGVMVGMLVGPALRSGSRGDRSTETEVRGPPNAPAP